MSKKAKARLRDPASRLPLDMGASSRNLAFAFIWYVCIFDWNKRTWRFFYRTTFRLGHALRCSTMVKGQMQIIWEIHREGESGRRWSLHSVTRFVEGEMQRERERGSSTKNTRTVGRNKRAFLPILLRHERFLNLGTFVVESTHFMWQNLSCEYVTLLLENECYLRDEV